ncbi:coniferyl aldehyde dehydrogenase [Vibrio lamellibrachiae]|uniref:coniferyl aldehyde dehydrogenase n=1 Tax=Vibrio lamellibrachiae TaxID=2910253 RepID=UPI003D105AC2
MGASQSIDLMKQQEEKQYSDLETRFEALKVASMAEPYPSFSTRQVQLKRLKHQLRRYQDVLCDAMNEDFSGRAHTESMLADILAPTLDITHVLSKLRKWMKPQRRATEWLFKTNKLEVRYQPKGVVGIICPWNFPLYLSLGPMITAIAAGNRCMIKMPPNCPSTTSELKRMLSEVFTENQVCVISGDHPEAMEISNLPFDHLVFTGSPTSGKAIMANAAKNLTPVTLELGGKSPAIVLEDYDIEKAATRIAHGKGFNAGQICIAPDYALVPQESVAQFVEALKSASRRMYSNAVKNEDYTSLIDDSQRRRFKQLLQDARDKGAKIVECSSQGKGRREPFYIATNLSDDMRICKEEIFGPLLPVHGYSSIEEVQRYVVDRARPLACYIFGNDKHQVEKLLTDTHSGGVTINDWGWHALNHSVPFGGIGNSGFGNYHGEEGFRELSHSRSVLRVNSWFPIHLFAPPYGTKFQQFVMNTFVGKADESLSRTKLK